LKKFNLIQSLNFLPVFFFSLAISPNISGDRIGLVLFTVFFLLIPAANYITANSGKRTSTSGNIKYSFVDFLALLLVMAAVYLGWKISWQFNLAQILYLTFVALIIPNITGSNLFNIKLASVWIGQGLILFAILYLGLNQYFLENLLRTHVIVYALLSSSVVLISLYLSKLRAYYKIDKFSNPLEMNKELKFIKITFLLLILVLAGYGLFFLMKFSWSYTGYLVAALIPASLISIRLIRQVKNNNIVRIPVTLFWLNIILALSLDIFFIYFFLESTQILQAIQGGF